MSRLVDFVVVCQDRDNPTGECLEVPEVALVDPEGNEIGRFTQATSMEAILADNPTCRLRALRLIGDPSKDLKGKWAVDEYPLW